MCPQFLEFLGFLKGMIVLETVEDFVRDQTEKTEVQRSFLFPEKKPGPTNEQSKDLPGRCFNRRSRI